VCRLRIKHKINSITVSVAWVQFCSAAGITFWHIGPIRCKDLLCAWKLSDQVLEASLELVRRDLIPCTFGKTSGIDPRAAS
jgi:hypothetical protein